MPWLQLSLELPGEDPDRLAECLSEAGAVAVTLEPEGADPLYEPAPGATPLWPRTRVVGLFPAHTDAEAVAGQLARALSRTSVALDRANLPDQDWARVWLRDFRPMGFGNRLWVCPHGQTPPQPDAVVVFLDPGLAFGTGTHPSTALCLEWLDQTTADAGTVMDYGCGSGILAIAAAKLGASRVWAVDHDPQALQASVDNAHRNGVAERLRVLAPDTLDTQIGPTTVDRLVANILAEPLKVLAPRFAGYLRPGGALALAGVLEEQAEGVMQAYRPWFTMEPPRRREGWVLLRGRRQE